MEHLPRRNVELKARDPSPRLSVERCVEIGARDLGVIWQRDTYFEVARGRLKLREERPGSPQLIQYARDDRHDPRPSNYRIVPVPDADSLRAMLDACLGTRAVVTKHRHLFLWQSVRIHIDEVDVLGSFIEMEAVAAPESDFSAEYTLISELRERFGITDDRLVSVSYADQVMQAA